MPQIMSIGFTMPKSRKNFSDRLRELMASKGITLTKLSDDLDLPTTTVSNWIRGASFPRADKLDALATYFNVSIDDLMNVELSIETDSDNDNQVSPEQRLLSAAQRASFYQLALGSTVEERYMLEMFRKLPADRRNSVVAFILTQISEAERSDSK